MYFACLTLGYMGTMMGVNNLHMGKYVSLVFLPNIWGGDVNKNRIYALKRQLPTTYETHTLSLIVMRSAARLFKIRQEDFPLVFIPMKG